MALNLREYHDVGLYLDRSGLNYPPLIPHSLVLYRLIQPFNQALGTIAGLARKKLSKAREELKARLTEGALKGFILDSGDKASRTVWKRYHSLVSGTGSDRSIPCYVHVVKRSDGRLAIQYWFFYYYNDMWNEHQADFEFVAVYFRKNDRQEYEPSGCGYAGHREGSFRLWQDVWRIEHTHPLAYVSRGSHAFHFVPRFEGYNYKYPWAGTFLPFVHINAQIAPKEGADEVRDVVPLASHPDLLKYMAGGKGREYKVVVMPDPADVVPARRPGSPTPLIPAAWDDWWWLRYEGFWGPANHTGSFFITDDGITSPSQQDIRWDDPWGWLESKCHPDEVGDWRQL